MAGGKIKGIPKKEDGDVKKFEWGQRRGGIRGERKNNQEV